MNVTEAAKEVAPWTGVPGGALSRQGEAEAVLNLLNLRSEVLEHDVEAILMSHHKKWGHIGLLSYNLWESMFTMMFRSLLSKEAAFLLQAEAQTQLALAMLEAAVVDV